MSGKGSVRRFENTRQVERNIGDIKFGERDKSKDTFKVKVNGQIQEPESLLSDQDKQDLDIVSTIPGTSGLLHHQAE